MDIKIYLGDSKCVACNKKHKKIFEIDGKPYGSSCAKEIIGKNLSAPIWLYELAEKYVQDNKHEINEDDFIINFWNSINLTWKGDQSKHALWNRTVKINGKNVCVDWQYEIADYLKNRYKQLRKEE